jgi:hypothetical protein
MSTPSRPSRLVVSLLLVSVASVAVTGCKTRTNSNYAAMVHPQSYSVDRAVYIEERAGQLVRRGVPRDQAADAAAIEWANGVHQETRVEAERRVKQDKFVSDLEKMQRAR